MGHAGWSQFTTDNFVSAAPSSSCFSTAPAWGTSYRIQSFRNFSSADPSHREQSFGNKLLQCVPSTGPARKPSPAWVLSHRPQFLPGVCSTVGFPWAAAALRAHPPSLVWGPPWAAGEQCATPQSFPWAARESVLQCLGHVLPLLLH